MLLIEMISLCFIFTQEINLRHTELLYIGTPKKTEIIKISVIIEGEKG